MKAEGASRRIESVGNSISLQGKTLGGKAFDLSQLKGKVVLIHYWASDIDACRTDMAQLEKMMRKYGDNFVVVGVSLDTDPQGPDRLSARKRASAGRNCGKKAAWPTAWPTRWAS